MILTDLSAYMLTGLRAQRSSAQAKDRGRSEAPWLEKGEGILRCARKVITRFVCYPLWCCVFEGRSVFDVGGVGGLKGPGAPSVCPDGRPW